MKRYTLKKDLPMYKAGTEAVLENGALYLLDRMAPEGRVLAFCELQLERHPNILTDWFEEIADEASWEENAIKSKLANLLIAPEDYIESEKKHFTWEEACAAGNKLGNGWRLPTRSEWALICEEFGQKDGILNTKTLIENLGVGRNGADWYDGDGVCYAGYNGYYWSSTPYSSGSTGAYNLNFGGTTSVNPSNYNDRQYGFSVRLVKDLEAKG